MNHLNRCKKKHLSAFPVLFSDLFASFKKQQGDWSRFAYPVQRSYGISVDEWSDQPLVPADLGMDVVDIACKIILITSHLFADGNRPSQEPAHR